MTYHIRPMTPKQRGIVRQLHQQTFGGTADMIDPSVGWWWIAWSGPTPVGFAGMVRGSNRKENYAYFIRAGVLRSHRGHSLQLRLARVRARAARKLGFSHIVTDTTDNPWSEKNLQKAGFTPYDPKEPWGLSNTIYWRKQLG